MNSVFLRDFASGIVLLAIAAAYHFATGDIAESTLADEVGAAGLPRLLALILAAIALVMMARALIVARSTAGRARSGDDEADEAGTNLPRALGFLLLGFGYVLLLPYLGYAVCVALLIAAVALYEGAARRWTVPAAAIGGATLYWAIFVKLLGVHQPVGMLFQGLLG